MVNRMDFNDKVVLVTGSSRGIGRSIAVRFAAAGANVIINYRSNKNEAETITEIIASYGKDPICIKANVADEEEVKKMVDKIMKHYGHIDVLVKIGRSSCRERLLYHLYI